MKTDTARPAPRADTVDAQNSDGPPSAKWQSAAERFVDEAVEALWTLEGTGALVYLQARRRLTADTVKRCRLGFNPNDRFVEATDWGLPDGRKIWLPRGVVIPCRIQRDLWYVTIRRPHPGDELANLVGGARPDQYGKYVRPRGHGAGLFGADTLLPHAAAVVTEGEFDAILLAQEAGDLVGAVTMGGAQTPLGPRWRNALLPVRLILAAFDGDHTGAAARNRLGLLSRRVRPAPPIGGKDITEMSAHGRDLRQWVAYLLRMHDSGRSDFVPLDRPEAVPSPPRLHGAIPMGDATATIDGLRERILRTAFALGWPRIAHRAGHAIGGTEATWRLFAEHRATRIADLALAADALARLCEGDPMHGEEPHAR